MDKEHPWLDLASLPLLLAILPLRWWVLYCLWGWHMVPIGLPALTVLDVAGLSFVTAAFWSISISTS